jgi:hypothetical protein
MRKVTHRVLDQYRIQHGQKIIFIEETNDFDIGNVITLTVNEQNSGRAKQFKTLEECCVIGGSIGNINLQQDNIFQAGLHFGI